MKVIIGFLVHGTLIALMYFDEFKGISYAGNIAIFFFWFFIVISIITIFIPPERIFKGETKTNKMIYVFHFSSIAFAVMIGWTITAIAYLIGIFSLMIKRSVYLDELQEKELVE